MHESDLDHPPAAAVFAGIAVYISTIIAATKTIAMTTLQKAFFTVIIAILAGAGIYEAIQAAHLRDQIKALQQQQSPLAGQLAQLQSENSRLSNLVDQAKDQKSLSEAQFNELLKLRGQTGQARTALEQAQTAREDLAKLKTSAAQQSGAMPAFFTNAMAMGLSMGEKIQKKSAIAKLDRMTEKFHLTDYQAQSISNLMVKNIELRSQQALKAMNGMMGKQTSAQDQAAASALPDEEAEIKALLTPDQLAAYPDFKQAETMTSADNSAKSQMALMTGEMDLSQEQQDKVHAALYQLNMNQTPASPNQTAIAQARASGNYADIINLQIETRKQSLENELKALDGILTPEQLKTYEQKQLDMIDMQTSAMKMFLPQTNNAVSQ